MHEGTPLNYFCETCRSAICSDCAMFEGTHKGHNFTKIAQVYHRHAQHLREAHNRLSAQLQALQSEEQMLHQKAVILDSQKAEKLQEIETQTEAMRQRIETHFELRSDEYDALSRRYALQIHELSNQVERFHELITTAPKSTLIAQSTSLEAEMARAKDKNDISLKNLALPPETRFYSELVPEYAYMRYELPDFYKYLNSPEC